MFRCLQLALAGKGQVSPNPLVGAVIVHKGKIIGEGYHRQYGTAHAEPQAIASVKDQSLLKDSTLYVNLEPCSHYGRTPPCASLIIEKQIPRVVIGSFDPYPEVSGRGICLLKEAGIEVETNFLREECEEINKRFLTFYRKNRPYIILKWAQSSDNFIDRKRTQGEEIPPVHFSNELTRLFVHKQRAEEDAVLIGTNTALLDNPSLNIRFWSGKNPIRVILDKQLKIPSNYHLYNMEMAPSLFLTEKEYDSTENILFGKIDSNQHLPSQILQILHELKIQSLIIEGGFRLLSLFINEKLWDEAHIEVSPITLKEGVLAPTLRGKLQSIKGARNSKIFVYKNILIP